ncbi:MAG: cell division protein FtsQ/DivIB [Fidelibacterota bacterium]|jgi:cell division septal protein FtsQ|tara:strand:+ start:1253 stop:2014 length:762 start_codon:yes stop_codon:yes gene_type:complete
MKKMKKNTFTIRKIIGIGLSLLFLLSLVSATKWANYREYFILKKVTISGNNILTKEDYQKIVSGFKVQSINDYKLRRISNKIEENPFVKAVQVSRQFPNVIEINIVERKPLAIINLDEKLMIDNDAFILPNHKYSDSALIPVLSGFNPAKELYPYGEMTFSIKVKEAIYILNQLSKSYNKLYNNISEITLNNNDDYVIILSDRPTKVILGKKNILAKLNILKIFDKSLGQRQLTDFRLLDMRYNKQLVAREWT